MKAKIIGLLLATVSAGYAQEVNDSLSLKVVYDAKIKKCNQLPHSVAKFSLDLWGDEASLFYMSENPEIAIRKQKFAEHTGRQFPELKAAATHPLEDGCAWSSYVVQKNNPKPDTLKLWYCFGNNTLYYYEPIPAQDWQPEEGDTLIADYACQKARCDFRGRQWTAWYTLDIPYSNGPWKLGGLPGLILKADDAAGDFSFTCISISTAKEKVVLPLPYRDKLPFQEIKEVTPDAMQRELKTHLANIVTIEESMQFIFSESNLPSREEIDAMHAKLDSERRKRTACLIEDFGTPKDESKKKKK